MFEFLISFLAAAKYHGKVKDREAKENTKKYVSEIIRYSDMSYERRMKLFTDINLELDTPALTGEQLEEVVRGLKSYDESRQYQVKNDYGKEITEMKKRLAMAPFCKMTKVDAARREYFIHGTAPGYWWGRERFDYIGQIKHELMLEWERRLQEAGFQYDLLVFDSMEARKNSPSPDGSMLARKTGYRTGLIYIWSWFFEGPVYNIPHERWKK